MIATLGGHETYLHTKFQLSSPNSKASRFQKPCYSRFLIKVYCRGRSMSEQLGPLARLRCTLSGQRPICGASAPVFAPVQIEGQAPLSYFSSPFSCCCCGCCSFCCCCCHKIFLFHIYFIYNIYTYIHFTCVYIFLFAHSVYIHVCIYKLELYFFFFCFVVIVIAVAVVVVIYAVAVVVVYCLSSSIYL